MPDRGPHVVSQRTATLHQVSVVVLGMGDDPRSLPATLAEVVAGPTPLIVVDALAVGEITAATRLQLLAVHQRLRGTGRRLIVVNAPEAAVPALREHGIDVGSTADTVFGEDPMAHFDSEARLLSFGA